MTSDEELSPWEIAQCDQMLALWEDGLRQLVKAYRRQREAAVGWDLPDIVATVACSSYLYRGIEPEALPPILTAAIVKLVRGGYV